LQEKNTQKRNFFKSFFKNQQQKKRAEKTTPSLRQAKKKFFPAENIFLSSFHFISLRPLFCHGFAPLFSA
jgi:hypothetical protein